MFRCMTRVSPLARRACVSTVRSATRQPHSRRLLCTATAEAAVKPAAEASESLLTRGQVCREAQTSAPEMSAAQEMPILKDVCSFLCHASCRWIRAFGKASACLVRSSAL